MIEARILIAEALYIFGSVLQGLIVFRALLSWLPIDRDNVIVRFLNAMTEPILGPIRNLIFKSPMGGSGMMIDFSPIIAWIVINLVTRGLAQIIRGF